MTKIKKINILEKEILIENKKLSYEIKKSRKARNLRLTIYPDGKVIATLPCGINESLIDKFILEKSKWIFGKLEKMRFSKNPNGRLLAKFGKREYNRYKKQSFFFIKNRLEELNKFYNFNFKRISIRNQRTRWGSCSRRGNLNFNYKLIFLPERLADYVIIHELCHIKEFNHSASFWNLVAETVPDYKDVVKKLRKF